MPNRVASPITKAAKREVEDCSSKDKRERWAMLVSPSRRSKAVAGQSGSTPAILHVTLHEDGLPDALISVRAHDFVDGGVAGGLLPCMAGPVAFSLLRNSVLVPG